MLEGILEKIKEVDDENQTENEENIEYSEINIDKDGEFKGS